MGRSTASLDAEDDSVPAAGVRPAAATAFSSFPPAAARALRAASVLRVWTDGDMLLTRDRVASSVMAIIHGRARILAVPMAGPEVFVRWQLPGETVGLASAVSGLVLPVDVIAADDCETLQVERDVLLTILRSDAEYALAAAALLARHAYDLVNLLAVRTEETLAARVLGVLRHLALLNGRPLGGRAWGLPLSQTDIASAVGSSRSRVNAELRALERDGAIQLGYRQVIVRDLDVPPREGG